MLEVGVGFNTLFEFCLDSGNRDESREVNHQFDVIHLRKVR
jgi:hypothetical protein